MRGATTAAAGTEATWWREFLSALSMELTDSSNVRQYQGALLRGPVPGGYCLCQWFKHPDMHHIM
jgi:hypothetical protein